MLDGVFRREGGRIIGALAARYRDLDAVEEAFAEACARAAAVWPREGEPRNPAAWLYRTASRCVLDALRWQDVRRRVVLDPPAAAPTAEDLMAGDAAVIPDERLRLIFICCHPAVAAEARAALTLRLVCGLKTEEIARAFLVPESTLAQRLVRAKRKIAEAGVPFELPGPEAWAARLDAVLSTLEVAYAKREEDAAGVTPHSGRGAELLELTETLAELLPEEPEVLALAATVRYAEARRAARVDASGVMVALAEQNPALWDRGLIAEGEAYLRRAAALRPSGPRALQAAIHSAWCARGSLAEPVSWPVVLRLYDALVGLRDDAVVRINRAVALAEVAGPAAALAEISSLDMKAIAGFPAYYALRADLLRRLGRIEEARGAYRQVLALGVPQAERLWLEGQLRRLG
ncbi:MAG: RNA polymerase subunit sigma-70 [Acetobacteraceae bacterium]|nr:RNA polymerase subunit sigma-70 [Acetobacteraceae bacterium]